MVDELRQTMTAVADQVSVPLDLLDRVEAQARGIRHRRRVLVAGGTALSLALVAAVVVLPREGPPGRVTSAAPTASASVSAEPRSTRPSPQAPGTVCTIVTASETANGGPLVVADHLPDAPVPANVLRWPCRGHDVLSDKFILTRLQARQEFAESLGIITNEVGTNILWEEVVDGRPVGVYQFWPLAPGSGRQAVTWAWTVVDSAGPQPVWSGSVSSGTPGAAVILRDGLRLALLAPDATAATYVDGTGTRRPLQLSDGAAVLSAGAAGRRESLEVERGGQTTKVPFMTSAAASQSTRPPLPTASPGASQPAALSRLYGADGLTFEKPWVFRGDRAAADKLLAESGQPATVTFEPLWQGTVDGGADGAQDFVVTLARRGPAAGETYVETYRRVAGAVERLDRQTLLDGVRVHAVVLVGPLPRVHVLGPPGTSYIFRGLPCRSGATAPARDGADVLTLGETSPTNLKVCLVDRDNGILYDGTVPTISSNSGD